MAPSEETTGGPSQLPEMLQDRKTIAFMTFTFYFAFAFGLLMGRYHDIYHSTWYAALPMTHVPTPPEQYWFFLTVGLSILFSGTALYYGIWCKKQTDQLDVSV